MSRRECKHGKACGDDLCPLDDDSLTVLECPDYEDSGYRRKQKIICKDTARLKLIVATKELNALMGIKLTFYNGKKLLADRNRMKRIVERLTIEAQ